MTDEKRFLNNLVGENWDETGKLSLPKWIREKKSMKKRTIQKRVDTFEEEDRKEGNEEMLHTHF